MQTVQCAVCKQPITPYMDRAYRSVRGRVKTVHRACHEEKIMTVFMVEFGKFCEGCDGMTRREFFSTRAAAEEFAQDVKAEFVEEVEVR